MSPILEKAIGTQRKVSCDAIQDCSKQNKAALQELIHECDEVLMMSGPIDGIAVQIVNAVATAILRKK